MNEPDYLKKRDTVLTFFKEAFCIDGEAEFVKRKIKEDYCVKLTDSRRGVFYIATESRPAERKDR